MYVLSNLCRATSGGYINFGCSREVLFLRGYFQWSVLLSLRVNYFTTIALQAI